MGRGIGSGYSDRYPPGSGAAAADGGVPGSGGCNGVYFPHEDASRCAFSLPLAAGASVAAQSRLPDLDGIQDPGNLGTILRTADALDVPVILTQGCADPYGWKTVRASMGAVFRSRPMRGTQEEILSASKTDGVPLAAAALSKRAKDIRQAHLNRYAVIIGSEGRGVSRQYLEACSRELIIPMNPRCESLNAATAAAIVMWQIQLEPGGRLE